jgi:2-hydroxychromene-2-carboxylate isomerase
VPQALEQPVFYYDLGCPECYLAAEHVLGLLPVVPEWEPVLGAAGFAPPSRPDLEAFAGRVQELGMQPLRWPSVWPAQTRTAMLAATYAKHIGRAVAFSLAAFRQAFAGGRDLGDVDTVLIAAAACEMHPAAVLKGIGLQSVADRLQAASAQALTAGVRELPAVRVGGHVFTGSLAIEQAARALADAA